MIFYLVNRLRSMGRPFVKEKVARHAAFKPVAGLGLLVSIRRVVTHFEIHTKLWVISYWDWFLNYIRFVFVNVILYTQGKPRSNVPR